MKRSLINFGLLFIIFITIGLTSCEKESIKEFQEFRGTDLKSKYIKWIGRTEYKEEDEMVYFYFTATGFEITFVGSGMEVEIYASSANNDSRRPYFQVSVDDEVAPVGKVMTVNEVHSTVTVVDNLEVKEHKVTFLKTSEPYDGYTAIKSIRVKGQAKEVTEETNLRFQIIGASGISGHGALGEPNEPRTTENSSSLYGFGYLTARIFGGETQFISNSGMGLVYGYRYEGINNVYDYVGLKDDEKSAVLSKWDHQSWIPDIVIINIGGNDYNSIISSLSGTQRTQAVHLFKTTVVSFCEYIHTLYPNVKIIWTHTGSTNGHDAESAILDASLQYVKVVEIPKVASNGELAGANNHNGLLTHIRTAQILADVITSWLGIDQIDSNDVLLNNGR